jgi:hypothetical protein
MDIQGSAIIKGNTANAFVTGFPLGVPVLTIDCLGKNTGTGGLSNTAGPAK